MEIIIDEFFDSPKKSLFWRLKHLYRAVKRNSYVLVVLALIIYLIRRYSERIPFIWLQKMLGRRISISPKHFVGKLKENEELMKKLETLDNLLAGIPVSEKYIQFIKHNQNEIQTMFNLEQLRESLSQSGNLQDQRMAVLDLYKCEILTQKCLQIFSKHMLDLLFHIKIVLECKYLEKFKKKYHNAISEVGKMTGFIVSEFFENLITAGLKNLMSHIKKNISLVLLQHKPDSSLFLDLIHTLEQKMLCFNTKDLRLPDDNKRWSCACLSSFQHVKNKPQNKKITFTDFNVVSTEILEIEDEDHDHCANKPNTDPAILFPKSQGLSVPKNSLDILSIFTGDIANHKYFLDQEYIERYIIMADKDARAERYRCCLDEIREEEEVDSSALFSRKRSSSRSDDEIHSEEGDVEMEEFEESGEECEVDEVEEQNIEEARYYFALILKMFCGEIVDFLESSNLTIYMYYAIKYEFLQWKMKVAGRIKRGNGQIDFEDSLNEIYSEAILGESVEKKLDIDDDYKRLRRIEGTLKTSREQIYKSLFLSTSEYQDTVFGYEREKKESKKFKKGRILEYLITYGVGIK